MNLKVSQNVTPHDKGWWDWSVWLDGPENELDEIKFVEYVLHPTFSKPVQMVSNRDTNFRLSARGWGEFNIKVRVHIDDDDDGDDDTVIVLDHWLELDEIALTKGSESIHYRSASKPAETPRLYLSCAVVDIEFAYELKDALRDDGVEVLLKQDMSYEQSLESLLETQRRSIQGGVFVVSEVRNPWMMRDYWTLTDNKISSLVVQIGEPRDLPDEMEDLPRFQIKEYSETRQVVTSIARRVREQL